MTAPGLFRLEKRRDLALRLDVGRDARGRGFGGGFPSRRRLAGGRLVRLVEERVTRRRGRTVLALGARRALALSRPIEHGARIAHFTGFAPGTAAVGYAG